MAEIEIEAYERPLRNKDEFLENVEEREWRDLDEINSEIRSGGDDGLRVSLSITSSTGIRLTLRGANRRSRSAIEPDVVAAVEKHLSDEASKTGAQVVYAGPWFALAVLAVVGGFIVGISTSGGGASTNYVVNTTAFFLWVGAGFVVCLCLLGIGAMTMDNINKAMPAAEFLPDDETTRWATWRAHWIRRVKLVGAGITLAASLCGIAGLVILVAQ